MCSSCVQHGGGEWGKALNSDFDALARQLEIALWQAERLPLPRPTVAGGDLARAALIFFGNPTLSMIEAAQQTQPSLTSDQIRKILRAISASMLASNRT